MQVGFFLQLPEPHGGRAERGPEKPGGPRPGRREEPSPQDAALRPSRPCPAGSPPPAGGPGLTGATPAGRKEPSSSCSFPPPWQTCLEKGYCAIAGHPPHFWSKGLPQASARRWPATVLANVGESSCLAPCPSYVTAPFTSTPCPRPPHIVCS